VSLIVLQNSKLNSRTYTCGESQAPNYPIGAQEKKKKKNDWYSPNAAAAGRYRVCPSQEKWILTCTFYDGLADVQHKNNNIMSHATTYISDISLYDTIMQKFYYIILQFVEHSYIRFLISVCHAYVSGRAFWLRSKNSRYDILHGIEGKKQRNCVLYTV
jgi:hypothetical protein